MKVRRDYWILDGPSQDLLKYLGQGGRKAFLWRKKNWAQKSIKDGKHKGKAPEAGREKSQRPPFSSSLSILTCEFFIYLPFLGKQISDHHYKRPNSPFRGGGRVPNHLLSLNVYLRIQCLRWFPKIRRALIDALNSVESPTCYIWTTDVPSMQMVRWTMQTPLLKIQAFGLQLLTYQLVSITKRREFGFEKEK